VNKKYEKRVRQIERKKKETGKSEWERGKGGREKVVGRKGEREKERK
jgi:hypothetical protein